MGDECQARLRQEQADSARQRVSRSKRTISENGENNVLKKNHRHQTSKQLEIDETPSGRYFLSAYSSKRPSDLHGNHCNQNHEGQGIFPVGSQLAEAFRSSGLGKNPWYEAGFVGVAMPFELDSGYASRYIVVRLSHKFTRLVGTQPCTARLAVIVCCTNLRVHLKQRSALEEPDMCDWPQLDSTLA